LSSIELRNGFTKIPNFIFSLDLTSTEFHVLCVLYQHLPNVNPSVVRLCKICNLSERQIRYCFSSLEKIGLLKRSFKKGARTTYILHKTYDEFIAKKLSTKLSTNSQPLQSIAPLPLQNTTLTPAPHCSTPLQSIAPKQEKETIKETRSDFYFFKDEKELEDTINESNRIIKQLAQKKSLI